jgi:hypothetical protein
MLVNIPLPALAKSRLVSAAADKSETPFTVRQSSVGLDLNGLVVAEVARSGR